jgi:hypothetical protein
MSYLSNFMGGRRTSSSSVIYIQTATETISNSTVEANIMSNTAAGSAVLPANFFKVGTSLKVYGKGIHSSPGGSQITIKIKLGTTVILTTGAVASGNDTNAQFDIEGVITCRTTGASGTVFAQGHYEEDGSSPTTFQMTNTTTTTIDTTASQTVIVTAQWDSASASRSISMTNFYIEVLNP